MDPEAGPDPTVAVTRGGTAGRGVEFQARWACGELRGLRREVRDAGVESLKRRDPGLDCRRLALELRFCGTASRCHQRVDQATVVSSPLDRPVDGESHGYNSSEEHCRLLGGRGPCTAPGGGFSPGRCACLATSQTDQRTRLPGLRSSAGAAEHPGRTGWPGPAWPCRPGTGCCCG